MVLARPGMAGEAMTWHGTRPPCFVLEMRVWVKSGPGFLQGKTQWVVKVSTGLNGQSRAQQVAKDSMHGQSIF